MIIKIIICEFFNGIFIFIQIFNNSNSKKSKEKH